MDRILLLKVLNTQLIDIGTSQELHKEKLIALKCKADALINLKVELLMRKDITAIANTLEKESV